MYPRRPEPAPGRNGGSGPSLVSHAIDGVRLAVAQEGTGPPVLFQHGLCGDASQAADVFPPTGFRRITVECRGHGRSEAGDPQRFGLATFADDVAQVLDEARLGPLVAGGISMGAAIAARLAVRRPDLVRALVIVRPSWIAERAPSNLIPNGIVGDLLDMFHACRASDLFEQSDLAASLANEAPANLASLRQFFCREPRHITAALLSRIADDGPGIERRELSSLKVPTLVIAHEQDSAHPIALARELAGLIPGAEIVEVTPKASSKVRYRADIRAALRSFLTEHA